MACETEYSACSVGSCGSFKYYYKTGQKNCVCEKAVGSYEFIFSNTGYKKVGADYGGATTSVAGDSLFVRRKSDSRCSSKSWKLVLKDLGDCQHEATHAKCASGTGKYFTKKKGASNKEIARMACEK